MAESREQLLDLLAVASGASGFLVSKYKDLEFLVALCAMIFKYRHFVFSSRRYDLLRTI